jgi:large subunit ribosomal protein L25
MKSVPLKAHPRTATGRLGVKKLRSAERVPAVIYGRHRAAQNLELVNKELEDLLHRAHGENILVDLTVEGDGGPERLALVQEVQHHPLTGRVLHVDFHEVAADERVTVAVPVEAVGEAIGVKNGGVLEHVLFRVKVRALPRDLPEALTLDVSHLDIGQAIHIGDIQPPAGVEVLGDKHVSVLAVAAPVSEAEEAAAAAQEAAAGEPEVIKEKKEEGAGEAAKPGEKAPAKAGAEKAADKPAEKKSEKPAEKKK